MLFELLLAWASGLSLFSSSVLISPDCLTISCQKRNCFNCCYMSQRLEQCIQEGETDDLFYSFRPLPLAWQLIKYHIWWLQRKLDGPFSFLLSPSVCGFAECGWLSP